MENLKSKTFFNADEQERVRRAVVEAEKRTSGEIAVVIVDESDRFPESAVIGSFLVAGLVAVVIALIIGHITIWTYIPLVALLFYPSHFIFNLLPRLKLPLVSARRIREAVHQGAVRAFYEKGLHRTRHETGILIYISLLERKIWILGDRGINEKIDPGYWSIHARHLSDGLKTGSACDAVCRVIQECGAELERHFPYWEGDVNELPDHLIV